MARRITKSVTANLGRILVVEDDPVLAMAIEDVLRSNGASHVTVCSAIKRAMEHLESTGCDVLVLDVHLADRNDGWALAELVMMLGPKPPKIIFSTGSPADIPADIAELGCVLEKPYDPMDLITAITDDGKTGLFARLLSPR